MSNNNLEAVGRIFKATFNVEVIDFEYNQLTSVDEKLFRHLNLLKEINLSWNKFTRLEGTLFSQLGNLEKVSFY